MASCLSQIKIFCSLAKVDCLMKYFYAYHAHMNAEIDMTRTAQTLTILQ